VSLTGAAGARDSVKSDDQALKAAETINEEITEEQNVREQEVLAAQRRISESVSAANVSLSPLSRALCYAH